jgi:Cu+-exporting ATPase
MAKDPVCGMTVDPKKALSGKKNGKTYYFCSQHCKDTFLGNKKHTKHEHHRMHHMNKDVKSNKKISVDIGGMHCASCALSIEHGLKGTQGVKSAIVNFATKKATIEYDDKKTGMKDFEKAVKDKGYSIIKDKEHMHQHGEAEELKKKLIIAAVFALPFLFFMITHFTKLSLPAYIESNLAIIQTVLIIPVIYAGRDFYRIGIR